MYYMKKIDNNGNIIRFQVSAKKPRANATFIEISEEEFNTLRTERMQSRAPKIIIQPEDLIEEP